jgi:hypothetical protein
MLAVQLYESPIAVHIKQARFMRLQDTVVWYLIMMRLVHYSYLGKAFGRSMSYSKERSIGNIIFQNSCYSSNSYP